MLKLKCMTLTEDIAAARPLRSYGKLGLPSVSTDGLGSGVADLDFWLEEFVVVAGPSCTPLSSDPLSEFPMAKDRPPEARALSGSEGGGTKHARMSSLVRHSLTWRSTSVQSFSDRFSALVVSAFFVSNSFITLCCKFCSSELFSGLLNNSMASRYIALSRGYTLSNPVVLKGPGSGLNIHSKGLYSRTKFLVESRSFSQNFNVSRVLSARDATLQGMRVTRNARTDLLGIGFGGDAPRIFKALQDKRAS